MSSRSHILFTRTRSWEDSETGEENEETERVQFYKHHDGYPSVTVPQLREFYQYAKGRANDIEYFAATFPYWYKRKSERRNRRESYGGIELLELKDGDRSKEELEEEFEVPEMLTGMGICSEFHIHGDIEYYWVVDLNRAKIEMYKEGMPYGAGDGKDNALDWIEDREPDRVFELNEDPEKEVQN